MVIQCNIYIVKLILPKPTKNLKIKLLDKCLIKIKKIFIKIKNKVEIKNIFFKIKNIPAFVFQITSLL